MAKVEYYLDDLTSNDVWIVENNDRILPTNKNWLSLLDKVAKKESERILEVDEL